jgi:integrase
MTKLTVQQIDALKPTAQPYKKAVETGLLIRVAKDGVKTWIVTYMIKGKQRDYRLPRPYGKTSDDGHLSLKDARTEAEKIRALAREGIDYAVKLEQEREAEAKRLTAEKAAEEAFQLQQRTENLTVKDLFDAWITDGVRRKDGNAELRRSFHKDVLPEIGHLTVKNVTEHDLRRVLRKMVEREVNRLAVVTCANLTQMFLWAEKRQPWRKLLAEGNPAQLVEIKKIVSPDYDIRNERDRVLSEDEIRKLHALLAAMKTEYASATDRRKAARPLEPTTEKALWIMLATLCRVGELSKARWEHVDFERAEWFIPAEATKGETGKQNALTVSLSPFALRTFQELRALTGASEWCFPATFKDGGHICEKSISKQIGDRQTMFKKDRNGMPRTTLKNRSKAENSLVLSAGRNGDWTPHDLRRTGATMMQKLRVPADVIDRCQNHVLAGSKTRRHYLHHDYADEMREAWRLLGERLELLLQLTDNVFILHTVAA